MTRPARTARRHARLTAPPTAPPRARWWARAAPAHVALALAAVHLAVVLLLLAPTPHDGGDNAAYLALARSLLEDGSYRELWEPGAPAHTQYPPGWPLVVAGALSLGIGGWTGLKAIVALFSAAAVALAYLWARRASTPGVALVAGVLVALGPGVLDLARVEISDVPFWTFCMLALWGAERGWRAAPARAAGFAVAAVGVLLAYATRSAGLPLLVAALAWLAWERRWRALALLAAVVGPFALAWAARGRMLSAGGYGEFLWYVDPYRPQLGTVGVGGLVVRVGENVRDYVQDHLPFLLMGTRTGGLALAVGAAATGLAAAGWALRVRRREAGLAAWWLPLYLGLVLVWPGEWSGERFLLPVLPVLLVYAGEAVAAAGRRSGRTILAPAAAAAALALCLGAGMPRVANEVGRMGECRAAAGPLEPFPCMRPEVADYLGLARAFRGRLPAGSAVIARKPTLWWAESGYPARVYPYAADPDSLLSAAREAGARYLVIDQFDNVSSIHLVPAVTQRPQAFCVMHSLGADRATLMGIVPGADTLPNLRARPADEVVELGFSWCGAEYWAAGAAPARE